MSSIEFRLRRPNIDTPWGFRLQGGQDVNQPLTIQRVFNGSPADGNLQRGDVLLSINNNDVSGGYLKSAEELVRGSSNSITVVVRRTGQVVNSSQPYDDLSPQQPHHRTFDGSTSLPSRPVQQSVTSSHQSQPPQPQQHRANVWRPSQQQQHPTVDVYSNHSGDYPHSVTSPAGSAVSPAAAAGGTSGYQPVKTQWSVDSRQQQQQQQRPAGFGQQWSSGQHDHDHQTFPPFSSQQSGQHAAGNSHNYAAKHTSSPSSGTTPQSSHQQGQGQGQGSHFHSQPSAEDDDYEAKSVRDIKKMFNQLSKPHEFAPKQSARKPGPSHHLPQKGDVSISGSWDTEPSKAGSSSLLPKRQQPTSTFSQSSRASFSPPPSSAAVAPSKPSSSGIYDYPPPRQVPSAVGQLNRSTMSKPVAAQTKPGAGYSYQGIVTVTPAKTVHGKSSQSSGQAAQGKKKEFDPSQSLVYQMLQEENERKKRGEVDAVEEEEPRPQRHPQQQQRQQQQQQPGQGGRRGPGGPQYQQPQQSSRLQELLDRDQAQSQQAEDQSVGGGLTYGQQQSMSAKARREMSPSYPRHHPGHDAPSIHQSPSRQRQQQQQQQQQPHQQLSSGAANHQYQHHQPQQQQQHYYQQPAQTHQQMYASGSSSGGYDGFGIYDGGYQHASPSGYDVGYDGGIPISDF